MNESKLDALSKYLSDGTSFATERDDKLDAAGYLESFSDKQTCEECGADIAGEAESDTDGMRLLVCKEGHEFEAPEGANVRYRLRGDRVVEDACEVLDLTPTTVSTHYPEYVIAETERGVRVVLVCNGTDYERTLDALFVDAIKNHRVNALLIPDAFEGIAYETATKYPLGPLAPTFPLEMLASPEAVAETVEASRLSRERSEVALSEGGWEEGDLHQNLDQNPRLIESDLYYSRVFRETAYSGQLGDRLEEVCKAAFSTMDFTLDPAFGGTADRFENVTDIAFLIPPSSRLKEDGGRILGLTDTKSGSETNLSTEKIARKHANYLRQASHPSFDDTHIAHVFVVFSMSGREANEIDWYDAIEKEYRGGTDATMVVLYADALAQMVNAHLSMAQRNELNLANGGGIVDAFRPFFNYRLFKRRLIDDIRFTTRLDDESPTKGEKSYQGEYFNRERLLVVTKEMVHSRCNELMGDSEIEDVLSNYPSDRW
ncbi:hypothetical protein [Salinarchaeum laminariae]|uniref:hypothetical protein n=1 Tax=Salinarchaeum laminariae TaxID=869888 RepID=UPI0020BE83EE|nr:hypothetical protein [Salinarchaeum laminariae]